MARSLETPLLPAPIQRDQVCRLLPPLDEQIHLVRSWKVPACSVGAALERGLTGGRVVACNLGIAALDAAFAHAVLERQRNSGERS